MATAQAFRFPQMKLSAGTRKGSHCCISMACCTKHTRVAANRCFLLLLASEQVLACPCRPQTLQLSNCFSPSVCRLLKNCFSAGADEGAILAHLSTFHQAWQGCLHMAALLRDCFTAVAGLSMQAANPHSPQTAAVQSSSTSSNTALQQGIVEAAIIAHLGMSHQARQGCLRWLP